MIGRDVGEDGRVVRFVAHPAQHDPAPSGLEHADLDVRPAKHLLRAGRPGPVAGLDQPLVDEDAVRGRRADVLSGLDQDVGDQPGHGRLAVGPRDRDDRDAPLRVADPRSAAPSGRRDPLGPAGPEPLLGAGQLRGPRRRDVALGEGDGRLGQDAGAFLPAPRERDDPVARVGRAMDGETRTAFAVIHAKPADPGHDRGDRIGPLAGRHRGAEPDQGVAAGIALAVPGPAPPDRDLHLDHRLEPVDVRSLEQADLDQSHGPGRIATRTPA